MYMEENNFSKDKQNPDSSSEESKISADKLFMVIVIVMVVVLALIFILPRFMMNTSKLSFSELHKRNIEGKLSPEKGYMYKGIYSFVQVDGLWYTQLSTPDGSRKFNMPFHYSPRDVEQIEPIGVLNASNLEQYKNFFVTFDPEDENLNYIGVAIGEMDQIFVNVFGKGVIGSCTKNATGCENRPIVECNSTTAPVFYFASEEKTNLLYLNTCVVISGKREELFKATDRMLFELLGIIASS